MLTVRLKPASMTAFRQLVDRDAFKAAHSKVGCRRFDILIPDNCQNSICWNESRSDRVTFQSHPQTTAFNTHYDKTAPFVLGQQVEQCALACEGTINMKAP
jgi:quinol monooxygenase YgiN